MSAPWAVHRDSPSCFSAVCVSSAQSVQLVQTFLKTLQHSCFRFLKSAAAAAAAAASAVASAAAVAAAAVAAAAAQRQRGRRGGGEEAERRRVFSGLQRENSDTCRTEAAHTRHRLHTTQKMKDDTKKKCICRSHVGLHWKSHWSMFVWYFKPVCNITKR